MEMFEELLVVVAVAAHLLFDPDTRVRLLEALVEIPVTEVPEHGDPEDDLPARRRLRASAPSATAVIVRLVIAGPGEAEPRGSERGVPNRTSRRVPVNPA